MVFIIIAQIISQTCFNPTGIAVASGWGLVGQFPDKRTHDLMVITFYH